MAKLQLDANCLQSLAVYRLVTIWQYDKFEEVWHYIMSVPTKSFKSIVALFESLWGPLEPIES